MKSCTALARKYFFTTLTATASPTDVRAIVLTHVLPDRPELLSAINRVTPILAVVAIPYSKQVSALELIATSYHVVQPTLAELNNSQYLIKLVRDRAGSSPILICEV